MHLKNILNVQIQQVNDSSAGYYTQIYRPPADFDGRISPFTASGAAIKYGNLSVMPTQTGHAQEVCRYSLAINLKLYLFIYKYITYLMHIHLYHLFC